MPELSNSLIRKAEKTHYDLNADGSFLIKQNMDDAVLIWSNIIEDFFWNYAGLVDAHNPARLIEKVKEFYRERDRQPGIYVTPASRPEDLEEILREKGFEVAATDAWMFYREKEKIKRQKHLELRTVDNEDDIENFVGLFGRSYGGEGEDETYGDLPDYYREAERKGLKGDLKSETAVNFIVDYDGEEVGIASMRWKDDFVGIYDVAVVPEFRGQGIGSALVKEVVRKAQERGFEHIFLQTEKGSSNEKFFRGRGFETEFIGKIMVTEKS